MKTKPGWKIKFRCTDSKIITVDCPVDYWQNWLRTYYPDNVDRVLTVKKLK